jgi:S-formylglutathione hydrolase FrmB
MIFKQATLKRLPVFFLNNFNVNKMKHLLLVFIYWIFLFTANAGTVDSISVYSNLMKKQVPVVVIKPTNYKNSEKNYPVVYLLHGFSGNQNQWLNDAPQLLESVDQMNIILVCPDGGFGSWYFDSPIDSTIRYESFITNDLVSHIDKYYKTIPNKSGRAITGLSMGGHGSMYLAIRHSEMFGAAGSISGGVDFRPFPNNWNIKKSLGTIEEYPENWEKNTVINIVDSSLRVKTKIVMDCGTEDFFLTVNRNLHQKLLTHKIEHDYTERPGAHNKKFWGNAIDYQLMFFVKYFKSV